MSYDDFPWCEVCGCREIVARFGLGDLGVCRPCFDELDAAADAENNKFKAVGAEGSSSPAVNLKKSK